MRRADLKVGFGCNNRCVFCAQGEKRARCRALSFEELLRRLRVGRLGADALVLTGGEPTLHKRILDIARAARAFGFKQIQLQTNGRLLAYPRVLRALVDAGITEISPSLHGPDAALHDALTRAPGSFGETTAGIENALALGLPLVTNTVVVRDNVGVLPAIVKLLGELGVRQAQLAFVHPVGTALARFDEVVARLADLPSALSLARAAARERSMRLVTEAVPRCFLRGMQELAVESSIPETTVLDLDTSLDYSRWRRAQGKVHGPPCEGCAARMQCEGPWREYPERLGWSEFRPLNDGEVP